MSEYIIEVDYDIRNGTFTQKRKEEITRCRDCKHYEKLPEYFGRCHPLGIMFADMDDGFCAWAERKEVAE